MAANKTVTVEGRRLELSHLDKVFYPQTGYTKAQVIEYYRRIAPHILPHLQGRPVVLKRYPDGVAGESFYEKTCPAHRPAWLQTSGGRGGIDLDFCLIDDLPSLVWIANLASIEIHTLLATLDDLSRPTSVAFDLDPGPPATLLDCLDIALVMRDMLKGLGLTSVPKVSGGKGLHFFVPLNTPVTYEQTKHFARTVAQTMERHYPDRAVSNMSKSMRTGKVLIDWSQNTKHKTTVCVYSLRARTQPTVSMPVSWEDVQEAAARKDAGSLIFTAGQALERLEQQGDLFSPVLTLRQELPATAKTQEDGHVQPGPRADGERLRTYRRRRDFSRTPEPHGDEESRTQSPVFVVQKHSARQVHYDLRIEAGGVLKSWSVPRGPSSDPRDRRLAVMTEDHPLAYRDFEGTIPRGQYGAGKVLIWDHGTYRNVTDDPDRPTPIEQAIDNGKVDVFFEGAKLRGGYVFIRMDKPDEQRPNWLLIKVRDEYAGSLPADLEEQPASVGTRRTTEDL